MIVVTPPAVRRYIDPSPGAIAKAAGEDSLVRAIIAALISPLVLLGSSLAELLSRRDSDPSRAIDWPRMRQRVELAVVGPLGDEADKGMRRARDEVGISFDLVPERAIAAAEAHAGELAGAITDTARDAVRLIIARGVREGRSIDAITAEVRSVIGLHPRWAAAVANRRRALESAKNPQSPARIDRLVAQYRERLLTYQARTLARTELLRSSNMGAHEGYRLAVELGAYPEGVEREWVTAAEGVPYREGNSRVCPVCKPLSGVRIDGLDESFVTAVGPVLFPPAHFACRCRCVLIPKGRAA